MAGRTYFLRQAATLLKLAQTTTDRQMAAALVEKATNLQSQVDDSLPDLSPQAPDVRRSDARQAAMLTALTPLNRGSVLLGVAVGARIPKRATIVSD